MNVREGIDITKMAISVMLLVLVIGAGLSVWYMMEDHQSDLQSKMNKATNSSAMEKLYELRDISDSANADNKPERYPLVSNVANAINEFNEDSLLYIYINDAQQTITSISGTVPGVTYTYEGVQLNDMPNPKPSLTPTTEALKLLLRYSKYRCKFEIVNHQYDNLTYTGLNVYILNGTD